MRIILAWALLYVSAYGQIEIPAETAPYMPIVASVATDIPAGATMDGGWTVSDGVHTLPSGSELHVWAKPGVHQIHYKGFWLLLKDVTFTDGAGNEITITSYLGHGFIDESAEFKVTGEVEPEPGPDPTPDEGLINADGLKVLIVRESGGSNPPLPKEQKAILTAGAWREFVGKDNYRILDPQTNFLTPSIWRDAMEATAGSGIPRLIISNRPHGGTVRDLPADPIAMLRLVEEWKDH